MKALSQNTGTILVFAAGILTSCAALAIVYAVLVFLNYNILGLYGLIIPAGSILAGAAAGSGYFLSSRALNIRPKSSFTILVAITAFLFYTIAYYLLFVYTRSTTSIDGFFRYMIVNAANASFTIGRSSNSTIERVGGFGYFLLLLEYLGFILGSVIPLAVAKDKPYCDDCKLYYQETGNFTFVPYLENIDLTNPKSDDTKALISKNNDILRAENQRIKSALRAKSYEEKIKHLGELMNQSVLRTSFFLSFMAQKCPGCKNHVIKATLNSYVPKEGNMVKEELGIISGLSETAE